MSKGIWVGLNGVLFSTSRIKKIKGVFSTRKEMVLMDNFIKYF